MGFSKSKYTRYCQCPKMLWIDIHKPEEKVEDPSLAKIFAEGHAVGELAQSYFGDFVDVTAQSEEGGLDYNAMIARTKECLEEGVENICEAAFIFNGNYCAVDILHKVEGGYEIYEVKSGKAVKDVNLMDVAYQKYVLEHCGITVVNTYILHVNGDYVRQSGDINLREFLILRNVNEEILPFYSEVEHKLTEASVYLAQENEPEMRLGNPCKKPYPCAYFSYCSRCVPNPSVFDLYDIRFTTACEHYYNGTVTYEDIVNNGIRLSDKQRRQVDYYLHDRGIYVGREGVRAFLNTLSFPLYFLDFETFKAKIPKYARQKVNQQVPFQYSLHIMTGFGEEDLAHKEFLAQEGTDPRRAIAQSLVENIPDDVCVLAYHKSFECNRLKELAEDVSEFREHLLKIRENIKDLEDVFSGGFVYNKEMGGSFSIKSVLPALFPNDDMLNYHNLVLVHNGSEAMDAFEKLPTLSAEERAQVREGLLRYCELDTYAMVVLYQWLVEHSNE